MRLKQLPYLLLLISLSIWQPALFSQTEIPNGDFENWQNVGNSEEEPTDWSSNKTGGGIASIGPQTCFQESSNVYSGSYCLMVETKNYFGQAVNGSATTGRVEAPNTNPANGYVHTIRSNPDFNAPFTGRPDSLVGWFRYEPENNDEGKIEVYLHGDYDVENPDQGGSSAFMIATATYLTGTSAISNWTRFSVPFTYLSTDTPQYILAVVTSSAVAGGGQEDSKLWVDALEAVYNPPPCQTTFASIVESTCDSYVSPSGLYTWTSSGIYSDTVLNAAQCDSIISIDLTIDELSFTVSQTDSNLSVSGTATSYQWLDCDNGFSPIEEATGVQFFPSETGQYAVLVQNNSCSDTSECFSFMVTGLEADYFRESIRLYPNPTKGLIHIQAKNVLENYSLELINLQGQTVLYQSGKNATRLAVDLSDFPAGMYYLSLANGESYGNWLIERRD